MTTPNEELRKQLQHIYKSGELYYRVTSDAADLLQSQAERIKELKVENNKLHSAVSIAAIIQSERDTLRAELADAELHTKQVERGLDKATAQLAEIEKTEPVAWINLAASSKMFRFLAPTEEDGTVVKDWQPLFTHPMPAQGVMELVEAFEYHIEQTRPIERSTIALSKYKGAK